jgi:eukaryotic-like serine/threonine-protein kinase
MGDVTEGTGWLLADRYRLVNVLGRGGMGAVWRARDERLGRWVAIKQLTPSRITSGAALNVLYERMKREAYAVAALKHPSIVTVYDQVLEPDGRSWLVMELIEGGSLADLIHREGPLPTYQVVSIGLQLLSALSAAHGARITHRDIKPANVLIEGDRMVLTDFGIAIVEGNSTLTQPGIILGTPQYMSPEQMLGRPATFASDLWALGATLYTTLEGKPPFASYPVARFAILNQDPSPAVREGPMKPVLDGLLRKDPAERLTAIEARALLERITSDPDGVQRHRSPPVPPAPVAERSSSDGGGRGLARRIKARSSKATISLALVAVLVLALVVVSPSVFGWVRDRVTEPGTEPPSPPVVIAGAPSRLSAFTAHRQKVLAVALAEIDDRAVVLSGGWDQGLRVSDPVTGQPIGSPLAADTQGIYAIAVGEHPLVVLGASDQTAQRWDLDTRRMLSPALVGHVSDVFTVTIARVGGRELIFSGGGDAKVHAWAPDTGAPVGAVVVHGAVVNVVAVAGRENVAVSGCVDGTLQFWDPAARTLLGSAVSAHSGGVRALAVARPGGRTLVFSAGNDGLVKRWDAKTREQVGSPLTGHSGAVSALAVVELKDQQLIVSGGADGAVRVWDAGTGKAALPAFPAHKGAVNALTVGRLADGRVIVISGGEDKEVRVWPISA